MSERIRKVNSLLKVEIGQILIREVDLSGVLATITRVDASPNLQQAKIYISVVPDDQADRIFKMLDREIYGLQQILNKRLKMRPVPKMIFVKENKTQEAAKIEGILGKVK